MEVTEAEHNHELLLTTRNLQELAACAFPYNIPVVPRSLPVELIEREHFVLAYLCKSNPGSSSQEVAAQEDQVKAATWALVRSVRVTQPQSPRPAPRAKNKEGDRKRARHTKLVDTGLEGFLDWVGIIASESTKDEEMSRLAVGFVARMRKRARGSRGESTPISDRKRKKRSSPGEEA